MAKRVDWIVKRDEWVRTVTDLCDQVQDWAKQEHWQVKCAQKSLTETNIGSYAIPSLAIKTPEGTVYLDPIGRNIIGACGRVDITVYPTMNRMLLVLTADGKWQIVHEDRVPWPLPWNAESFVKLVHTLAAAA